MSFHVGHGSQLIQSMCSIEETLIFDNDWSVMAIQIIYQGSAIYTLCLVNVHGTHLSWQDLIKLDRLVGLYGDQRCMLPGMCSPMLYCIGNC